METTGLTLSSNVPFCHPPNWWQVLLFQQQNQLNFEMNQDIPLQRWLCQDSESSHYRWAVCIVMTILSIILFSFCTGALVDIITGLSSGHHRGCVHFSLPHRLVDFRNTAYRKCIVPMSFCKAVGQIGHTFGTMQPLWFFFNWNFYLYFTLFSVQCYWILYIYTHTHMYVFFFFKTKSMALCC